MEFGEHRVEIHTRETDLSVVYTIDPTVVDDYINSVEQLLAGDKYKVKEICPRGNNKFIIYFLIS